MEILKKLFIITLSMFSAQYCLAQSGAMKDPVSFKLKNGMNIIVAENLGSSKVYSSFKIEGEPVAEGNKPGADYVLNAVLNETAAQARAGLSFDEKGGNLASSTEDFDRSLSALSSSVRDLIIDQSAFEKAKAKLIRSLKANDVYYPESVTATALEELTLNDVRKFYSKHITPSRAYLTIVGNISVAKAKVLAKKSFGDWQETVLFAKSK